jgi:chromosomal replication initiation ATPase DnaA
MAAVEDPSSPSSRNPWEAILSQIRARMEEEDFRRWFGATAYASDSGDQISVWVPTEAIRRHLVSHFQRHLDEALDALDRTDTHIRFIVTGVSEDEDDES